MKAEIHPDYVVARVRCTCGNEFTTHATREEYHLEICSQCHPFYTGRQKLVDTGGRVERFQRRVAKGRLGAERASAKRARAEAEVADAETPAPAAGARAEREQPESEAPQANAQVETPAPEAPAESAAVAEHAEGPAPESESSPGESHGDDAS